MVLGKKVNASVNPSNWSFRTPRPKEVTGVVELQGSDAKDVNLFLVRAGLARHKNSEPYTMSGYTECQYEKAEEDARAAKRGLWRRAA
jgi:endonuclease YncB( thermonuclease family)